MKQLSSEKTFDWYKLEGHTTLQTEQMAEKRQNVYFFKIDMGKWELKTSKQWILAKPNITQL